MIDRHEADAAQATAKLRALRGELRDAKAAERQAKAGVHFSYRRFLEDAGLQNNMHQWVYYSSPDALRTFVELVLELFPGKSWRWYNGPGAAAEADLIIRADADGGGPVPGADGGELREIAPEDDDGGASSEDGSGSDCEGDASPREPHRPGRRFGRGNRARFSPEDAIVLYICVVKAGLTMRRAASLFGVSEFTAGRAFVTALDVLEKFFRTVMHELPTERLHYLIPERVRENLQSSGEDAAMHPVHLLDAFEIFAEAPFGELARAILWSSHKHHYTAKFLLGILSNGAAYFVSKAYGG
mmetsp:Transcript_18279/g.53265  ORF Transcript_18279/g.53265 Transcript_18279/m.53265 type:complete len:300 (-) Transcript_18279:1043-1942(-)